MEDQNDLPTPERTLSPALAVLAGSLLVNVPTFSLLFLVPMLAYHLGYVRLALLAVIPCFITAWLWWSVCVPRWRLWAYERVPSTGALHALAMAHGLVWPRGSAFEKTEIKSAAQRQRQQQLEQQFP